MPAFAITMLLVASAGMAQGQQQDAIAVPKLRIVPECDPNRPAEEIVVCGSREKHSSYRLPKLKDGFDPKGQVDSVGRERVRLMQGDESGIGSCSNRGREG